MSSNLQGRKRGRNEHAVAKRQRTEGAGGVVSSTSGSGGGGVDDDGGDGGAKAGAATPSDPQATLIAALARCFCSVDGYRIAREVRAKQRSAGVFLEGITYGEVDIGDWARVLRSVAPARGDVFVDVGSGTGKAVLCAAACHPLRLARGIEILPELHAAAAAAREAARAVVEVEAAIDDGGTVVELYEGDAFASEAAWTGWAAAADVVFATTTCFTEELHAKFGEAVETMRVGSRLIVTTQALRSETFELIGEGRLRCAKGSLAYFAYRKVKKANK